MQFFRYMAVGAALAVFTILLREVLALLMPDTPVSYAMSILIAYGVGILLSFELQQKITFGQIPAPLRRKKFRRFFVISVSIALFATAFAHFLRYQFGLGGLSGQYVPTVAFVITVLITAVASFTLNRLFVFNAK
jgi:putative flippase GtrA